jgi:hypothetical protein
MFGNLFGAEMPLAARFVIAFVVVLALIGATAWVVRRFGANRLGGSAGRGRQQPRLAVIDAANVDGRRKLVLIRRDNIEHLLMIGGPSDVVIEPNIVRAAPVRDSLREPSRIEPEMGTRPASAPEMGWPLQPIAEPAAPPVARAAREENWHAPEPPARAPRPENISGLAAELSSRLAAPNLPPQPQSVAPPRHEARVPAPSSEQDRNLAEMAQQLEAALRQPARAADAPPVKPVEPPKPQREIKMRIDPRIEARSEPKIEPPKSEAPKAEVRPEPKPAPRVEPVTPAAPAVKLETRIEPKSEIRLDGAEPKPHEASPAPKADPLSRQDFYDNLEEEMASLLGRPPGKP